MKLLIDEEAKEIIEVMGPYSDFAACVTAQKNKGHSDDSAHRICGEIKKRVGDKTTRGSSKG